MILAHLPSGYLLARSAGYRRGLMLKMAFLGAILPDFDMIYFHAIDSSVHHHRFWPHIPAVWLVISAAVLALAKWRRPAWVAPLAILLAGVWLHLLLDSWAGDIMWLWPLSDRFFHVAEVPATQSHWILSFLLHWTFLAEVVILAAAVILYFRRESP